MNQFNGFAPLEPRGEARLRFDRDLPIPAPPIPDPPMPGLTMAFQPIVDTDLKSIFGYEALVRGVRHETANEILTRIAYPDLEGFDRTCTEIAIGLAGKLHLSAMLTTNVAGQDRETAAYGVPLAKAVAAAKGFPAQRLMFEITRGPGDGNPARLRELLAAYKDAGFATAIDRFGARFGAGRAGLDLLGDFEPNAVKMDMALVRNIDIDTVQRAVVRGIAQVCREMGIHLIAVGVETAAECSALRDAGVHLFQGYLFARPGFEFLPEIPASLWGHVEHPQA